MTLLLIRSLQLSTVIGTHEWERAITQNLYLDLEAVYDIEAAAKTDDLKDTIDYSRVCEHLWEFAANQQCHLIERLACLLADSLTQTFGFKTFELTLHKPQAVAKASDIAIKIQRGDIFRH